MTEKNSISFSFLGINPFPSHSSFSADGTKKIHVSEWKPHLCGHVCSAETLRWKRAAAHPLSSLPGDLPCDPDLEHGSYHPHQNRLWPAHIHVLFSQFSVIYRHLLFFYHQPKDAFRLIKTQEDNFLPCLCHSVIFWSLDESGWVLPLGFHGLWQTCAHWQPPAVLSNHSPWYLLENGSWNLWGWIP